MAIFAEFDHSHRDHPSRHVSSHHVSLGVLAFALLIGPAGWAAQLVLEYVVASRACHVAPISFAAPPSLSGDLALLLGVNLICLALTITGAVLAVRAWSAAGGAACGVHALRPEGGMGRYCLVASCGIVVATGFAFAILFNTAELLSSPLCWNGG